MLDMLFASEDIWVLEYVRTAKFRRLRGEMEEKNERRKKVRRGRRRETDGGKKCERERQ